MKFPSPVTTSNNLERPYRQGRVSSIGLWSYSTVAREHDRQKHWISSARTLADRPVPFSMQRLRRRGADRREPAQQSIRAAYHKATMSQRKDNLYDRVLLACALARTDDLGYLAASDVRAPLTKIMKKRYDIPSFARHLNHFCEPSRGAILNRTGVKRRYRFRFANPLLQPFVIMQGIADELISGSVLEQATNP